MHGKPTLKKSLQRMQQVSAQSPRQTPYVEIGRWRLEESPEGDLDIINNATGNRVTLVRDEGGGVEMNPQAELPNPLSDPAEDLPSRAGNPSPVSEIPDLEATLPEPDADRVLSAPDTSSLNPNA